MRQIEIVLESIHAAKEQVSSDISDDDESESWVVDNNDPYVEQVSSDISDHDESENWVVANNDPYVVMVADASKEPPVISS